MLEPYDPEWIEEPVPPENAAALARVKAATRTPIATGERAHTITDIREFIETGVADVVQVDLTHFGGFLPMKHLAGWADAHYLLLAPHNVCGPVGTMANVHFAVATPNYKVLEHFNDFADPWVQDLVDHAPRVSADDGCFGLPDRPGLGVRLNHEACAAHPRTGGRLRLFEAGWEKRGTPEDQRRRVGGTRIHRSPFVFTQARRRLVSLTGNRRPPRHRAPDRSAASDRAPADPDRDVAGVEGVTGAVRSTAASLGSQSMIRRQHTDRLGADHHFARAEGRREARSSAPVPPLPPQGSRQAPRRPRQQIAAFDEGRTSSARRSDPRPVGVWIDDPGRARRERGAGACGPSPMRAVTPVTSTALASATSTPSRMSGPIALAADPVR
jgi:hypothetical protein